MQNFIEETMDLVSELKDVNRNNQSEVFECLMQTYKIRHDILHQWIIMELGLDPKLLRERRLSDIFGVENIEGCSKTPDIVVSSHDLSCMSNNNYRFEGESHEGVNEHYVIDVSVSSRRNLSESTKRDKYLPVLSEISKVIKNKIELYVLSIRPDFADIRDSFEKLLSFLNIRYINEVDYNSVYLLMNKVSDTKLFLKEYISDPELIERYLQKEFGKESTSGLEEQNLNTLSKIDIANKRYMQIKEESIMDMKESPNDITKRINMSTHEILKDSRDLKNRQSRNDFSDKEFQTQWTEKFRELLSDEDIMLKYTEKETSSKKILNSMEQIISENDTYNHRVPKPTHHIFIPLMKNGSNKLSKKNNIRFREKMNSSGIDNLRTEQNSIIKTLSLLSAYTDGETSFGYIKEMYKELNNLLTGEFSEYNIEMFNNGYILNKSDDECIKKKYHETYNRDNSSSLANIPIIKFARRVLPESANKIPKAEDNRFTKQKVVKIGGNNLSLEYKEFWAKSHSGFDKSKRHIDDKIKTSVKMEVSNDIDEMLDILTEKITDNESLDKTSVIEDFIKAGSGEDESILKKLKSEILGTGEKYMENVKQFKGFKYLDNYSKFCDQMMHFSQFSLPTNTCSLFSSGLENVVCIVNNSYHNSGKDVGKAFMTCGYTDDPRWLNTMFGKIDVVEVQGLYFFATNWRRLETFKLTFLRDQFYSITSTGLAALIRSDYNPKVKDVTSRQIELFRHHFSLKIVVGLTSNQKIAEMLADMRYAIMASFSEFSEIDVLCKEKFSPPFNTSLESWISKRIVNLAKQVEDFVEKGNLKVLLKKPVFSKDNRVESSIGGSLSIPSIWDESILTEIQDLLDDMFLYVHTIKEPSSIHHENIKAVNTILKYQNQYDKLPTSRKKGYVKKVSELKEFLMSDCQIGHVSEIVEASCRLMCSTQMDKNPLYHFLKSCNESPAEITSTKSSIPEYEREMSEYKAPNKKILRNSIYWGKIQDMFKDRDIQQRKLYKIETKVSKESNLPYSNRSKVHDCMLDLLKKNYNLKTIGDISNWNMCENGGKVLADICIKAQYGAKREFYVINVGAKSSAKVLESFFQKLCLQSRNEMISVPGDKKILVMQQFINDQIKGKKPGELIFFVNGDCTKWSAAETMECFMNMIEGLRGYLDERAVNYLQNIVDMWSNKKITIPQTILMNSYFSSEDNSYLESGSGVLNSQQNFLQGMFNYMSSFKAVCSSNLTNYIWKSLYPNSTLKMDHLEHSDDYSLTIKCGDLNELKKFRALHRICMKFHGFNDSAKKTNTQQFLMEFISLVSFNGHMTYPHIKKLKECGMNLGCTGFRDDCDSVISRVGECVRVGVTQDIAYLYQRIHLSNLYKSYSLLKGQHNFIHTISEALNVPVEIFGIPDNLPILTFLCRGSPNNYRLYNYSNSFIKNGLETYTVKDVIRRLYILQKDSENSASSGLINDDKTELRLYHPKYTFDIENNLIKKIRSRLDMTFEESIEFFRKHASYNFVKPSDRSLLMNWLESTYYKSTFAMAYSRNSRSQITLRLSTFSRTKCCFDIIGDEREEFSMTSWVFRKLSSVNVVHETIKNKNFEKEVNRAIMNCDNTVYSCYNFFRTMKYDSTSDCKNYTVASLTPPSIDWLNIDNSAGCLIQYIYNFDDMIRDQRQNKGIPSLEMDKKKIFENFGFIDPALEVDLTKMKMIFNEIQMSKGRRNMCMTYDKDTRTLDDYLRSHISKGSIWGKILNISSSSVSETINPHTGEVVYRKMRSFKKEGSKVLIDDCILNYVLMKKLYKMDDILIRQVLNGMSIFEKSTMSNITVKDVMQIDDAEDLSDLNSSEIKSLGFLRYIINGDKLFLSNILERDSFYSYEYESVPYMYKAVVSEIVSFTYHKFTYKAILLKSKRIVIITNNNIKRDLANSHIIAMKLFDMIKLSQFEKLINNTSFKNLNSRNLDQNENYTYDRDITILEDLFNYNSVKPRSLFKFESGRLFSEKYTSSSLKDSLETQQNVTVVINDIAHVSTKMRENISQKIFVDADSLNVFSGRQKVFTLPFLTCVQSNMVKFDETITIEMQQKFCNGLNLCWWNDSNRIQKLIHGDSLPTNKEDFSNLMEFDLKNKKFLFGRRLMKNMSCVKNVISEWFRGDFEAVITDVQDWVYKKTNNIQEPFQDNDVHNDCSEEEFDFNELDDDLGDWMSEPVFNFPTDLENDEDEEFDLYIRSKIDNIDNSSNSVSSKGSEINYMTKSDLENLAPFIQDNEEFILSNQSRSLDILENIGDPTEFVINKFYAEQSSVNTLSGKEILGLISRLKDMLFNYDQLSKLELFFTLNLIERIVMCLKIKSQIAIKEDFVMKFNYKQDTVDCMLRFDNSLTEEQESKCIQKGGFREDYSWFIPLPETRKNDILVESLHIVTIDDFCHTLPVEIAYERLFKVPFKRGGFVNIILNELF